MKKIQNAGVLSAESARVLYVEGTGPLWKHNF